MFARCTHRLSRYRTPQQHSNLQQQHGVTTHHRFALSIVHKQKAMIQRMTVRIRDLYHTNRRLSQQLQTKTDRVHKLEQDIIKLLSDLTHAQPSDDSDEEYEPLPTTITSNCSCWSRAMCRRANSSLWPTFSTASLLKSQGKLNNFCASSVTPPSGDWCSTNSLIYASSTFAIRSINILIPDAVYSTFITMKGLTMPFRFLFHCSLSISLCVAILC